MKGLTGKVCLITGSAGGIGCAIAEALAEGGARLVLHYHTSAAPLSALALRMGKDRAIAIESDLRNPSGASELWSRAVDAWGGVDVLVNNAAMMPAARLDDTWDTWHRAWNDTLQVNLVAAADLSREAVKHFRARGGGILVNIASRAAFRGDTLDYMAYAASKAGIVALTRSIARGAADSGVLAYTLAPGFVDTAMARPFVDTHGEAAIVRDIPLGKMVPPSEIGSVVAFLASGAATHATGATIDINGASYVR
jgi:NAD(P)-dependent dehydrogenase (short-subunit alcohol dehydrogenase family)